MSIKALILQNQESYCNLVLTRFGSSRSHMFFKIGVLRNFAIFTGKQLCWSLFLIKLQTFIKKRLQHRCFPVNIAKFLRTLFFIAHLRWLLLNNYTHTSHLGRVINRTVGKQISAELGEYYIKG